MEESTALKILEQTNSEDDKWSEKIADKVGPVLRSKGITLIRDKQVLEFKGRIKAFMEQIGRGNAVVVIICDKYLKSENCMFELLEIAKNGDIYDRIFPIVLASCLIVVASIVLAFYIRRNQKRAAHIESLKQLNQQEQAANKSSLLKPHFLFFFPNTHSLNKSNLPRLEQMFWHRRFL